jgi:hypothetical protein
VPYFKTGLENNEFCMWVTAEPLIAEEARKAMTKAMPGFSKYLKKGQIEILPHTKWYLKGGSFDSQRVLNGWVEKLNQALAKGYEGLRLTGNTFWLEEKDWKSFTDYEAAVNGVIGRYNMLALCTYCLDRCSATEIIDVTRNHEFALIKQEGEWELIESSVYKRAKEALVASENKYRQLIENMQEGIWVIDKDAYTIFVNPRLAEMLGYSVDDMIGKHLFSFLDEQGVETVKQRLERRRAGIKEQLDFEFRRKDGTPLYAIVGASPLTDQESNYVGAIAGIVDVTERKRAEEALKESQHDLNRAQAVARTGSWRLDIRRNELLWSDETYRLFGIPKGTPMTYEKFLATVHPEDGQYVDEKWQAALRGEDYDIEHRIVVGNEVKWVREKAELEFEQGVLEGGFGTVQDITERKRTQERYQTMIRTAMDGFWMTDAKGKLLDVNDSYCALIGYSREELLAMSITDVEAIERPEETARHLGRVKQNGYDRFETRHRSKDGRIIEVEVSANFMDDEGGRFFVFLRDITERKQAEEQLKQRTLELEAANKELKKVDQLKDEFIGLVSHELRTPLTVILGALNTVLGEGEKLSQQEIKQLIEDAYRETETLSNILANLLELARVQANRLQLLEEPVDMKEFIDTVIREVKRRAAAHEFAIDCRGSLMVTADRVRVERILLNLLDNAVKYSPQGSTIRVLARRKANEIVIGVCDEGIGISAEDQNRLFKPFQRLGAPDDKVGGTGLGLVVCQRLVEAQGGQIWVESQPGQGSAFYFTLPALDMGSYRTKKA